MKTILKFSWSFVWKISAFGLLTSGAIATFSMYYDAWKCHYDPMDMGFDMFRRFYPKKIYEKLCGVSKEGEA